MSIPSEWSNQFQLALAVRWSKWSVLLRSRQSDRALTEVQRIAQQDANNPLVPLRLAQELRKLDRLEESLEWYKKTVTLVPNLPGWRLAMARAQFDTLVWSGRTRRSQTRPHNGETCVYSFLMIHVPPDNHLL